MRKLGYGILIIACLALLLFLGRNEDWNKKGPPTPKYSENISESKENDVFQFEVVTNKSTLALDGGPKFEIKNAWVENSWASEYHILGKSALLKYKGSYQLIMNIKIDSAYHQSPGGYYFFIGNKRLDTFVHYYCDYDYYQSHSIDTIKVPLYRETSPHLSPRKKRIAFDSLTFIKQTMNSEK